MRQRIGHGAGARRRIGLTWGGTLLLPLASAATAQTASQIAPPSFAPPSAATAPPIPIPETGGNVVPAGAERLSVTLAGLVVEGDALDPAAVAALRSELVGKPVKVSAIFAAARAAEAAAARLGHILVRVIVPAQSLADGATLRLVTLRGFIERVDVTGVPPRVRRRIAAILARVRDDRDLDLATLDRRLTLATDVPGVTLRSTLLPGGAAGATILAIDAGWRPVTAFLTADSGLSAALGRYTFGVGVDFNSVLGAGELIYLRASGLPNTGSGTGVLDSSPRNRSLAGGVVLPLTANGLQLTVEALDARTAPRHDPQFPGIGSRFQRLAGRLRYAAVHRRAGSLAVEAAFDATDERVRIIDPVLLPLSRDRLRTLRLVTEGSAYLPGGGFIAGRLEASQGLNILGARSAADATPLLPLSRQGADADRRKLLLDVALDRPLATHLALNLHARAQTSFGRPLVNAEQIGLAAPDAVSALPQGTLQGDAGFVARAELRAPFALFGRSVFANLTPYGFAAVAGARLEQPTTFERATTNAVAYGVGARFQGTARRGAPGLSFSVEYGRAKMEARHAERATVSTALRF